MAPFSFPLLTLPQRHEIHVWQLHWPGAIHLRELGFSWLAEDERDRAQKFVRQVDRDRFIISRGGLRQLLAQYLHCTPRDLSFAYGSYGKPTLMSPASELHFNLAHSGDWVIYGVSRCEWLGVDVEQISPRPYLEALIQRCLTPQEQGTLPTLTEARLQTFFQYWTVKEAHLKALGVGLSFPMTKVQVALKPKLWLELPACIQDVELADWFVHLWTPQPGAIASVCVAQSLPQLLIRSFGEGQSVVD